MSISSKRWLPMKMLGLYINSFSLAQNSGCLYDPSYCLHADALCGINGNCICPTFYSGTRCETTYERAGMTTLKAEGISSGELFLVSFFFLVLLLLLLYIVSSLNTLILIW